MDMEFFPVSRTGRNSQAYLKSVNAANSGTHELSGTSNVPMAHAGCYTKELVSRGLRAGHFEPHSTVRQLNASTDTFLPDRRST